MAGLHLTPENRGWDAGPYIALLTVYLQGGMRAEGRFLQTTRLFQGWNNVSNFVGCGGIVFNGVTFSGRCALRCGGRCDRLYPCPVGFLWGAVFFSVRGDGMRNHRTATRRLALAFLVCFAAAAVLSGALLASHAGHGHDHGAANGCCTRCLIVQSAVQALRQMAAVAACLWLAVAMLLAAASLGGAVARRVPAFASVALKTRLNN